MRIESRLSYRFLYKLVALHILFSFIAFCASVIEPERKGGPYAFHWDGFAYALLSITLVLLLFFAISLLLKKVIIIDDTIVAVRPLCFGYDRTFSLKEITTMDWENKNKSYGAARYGSSVSLNHKSFSIRFSGGYSLNVEGAEYANFQELQSFFFHYCKRNGIIKIAPLEERKKAFSKEECIEIGLLRERRKLSHFPDSPSFLILVYNYVPRKTHIPFACFYPACCRPAALLELFRPYFYVRRTQRHGAHCF